MHLAGFGVGELDDIHQSDRNARIFDDLLKSAVTNGSAGEIPFNATQE